MLTTVKAQKPTPLFTHLRKKNTPGYGYPANLGAKTGFPYSSEEAYTSTCIAESFLFQVLYHSGVASKNFIAASESLLCHVLSPWVMCNTPHGTHTYTHTHTHHTQKRRNAEGALKAKVLQVFASHSEEKACGAFQKQFNLPRKNCLKKLATAFYRVCVQSSLQDPTQSTPPRPSRRSQNTKNYNLVTPILYHTPHKYKPSGRVKK